MCSWPYNADVAFAIRDDDISYFTPPKKLDLIYENAWKRGFKVSFAVIPMHRAVNNLNVPPDFRNTQKYYPIYLNEELVNYLKSKISEGKVDIVQHGFCHTENPDLPVLNFNLRGILSASDKKKIELSRFSEFYGLSEKDCWKRVRKGKEILEQSFDKKVKVFIAPQEYLSKNLWKALRREGLYYCGGGNFRAIPIRNINLPRLLSNVFRYLFKKKVYPQGICDISDLPHLIPTYKHYWNKYINDESSKYWFNQFKDKFHACLKKRSFFILVTHYWEYFYDWQSRVTQTMQLKYLNRTLDLVNNYNVWKCTLTELFEWIFEKVSP